MDRIFQFYNGIAQDDEDVYSKGWNLMFMLVRSESLQKHVHVIYILFLRYLKKSVEFISIFPFNFNQNIDYGVLTIYGIEQN